MKRKKLLKMLTELMDREGRKKRKHAAELEELLKQLKEKQVLLEDKVEKEKDKHKRKRLAKELDIVKAQYAKGFEALQNLEMN